LEKRWGREEERRADWESVMKRLALILVAYVVASLDKALYDDYLYVMASNKQQINSKEVKEL